MAHKYTIGEAAHLRQLAWDYGVGDWSYNLRKEVFSSLRKKKFVIAHPHQLANFVSISIKEAKKKADEDEVWINSMFRMTESED